MPCSDLDLSQTSFAVKLEQCHLEDFDNLKTLENILSENNLGSLLGARLHLPSIHDKDAQGNFAIQGDRYIAVLDAAGRVLLQDLAMQNQSNGQAAYFLPVDACRLAQAIDPEHNAICVNRSVLQDRLSNGIQTFFGFLTSHYLLKGMQIPKFLPIPSLGWTQSVRVFGFPLIRPYLAQQIPGFKFYQNWWAGTRAFMGGGKVWFLNPYRWGKVLPRVPALLQSARVSALNLAHKTGLKYGGVGFLTYRIYAHLTKNNPPHNSVMKIAGPILAVYTPDIIRALFTKSSLLKKAALVTGARLGSAYAALASRSSLFLRGGSILGGILKRFNPFAWTLTAVSVTGSIMFDDYEENLYARICQDAYEVTPWWWKPVRWVGNTFIPSEYGALIANDNPNYEEKIRSEDQRKALEFSQTLPDMIMQLLAQENPQEISTYESVKILQLLTSPIELTDDEEEALEFLTPLSPPNEIEAKMVLLKEVKPELGYLERSVFYEQHYQEALAQNPQLAERLPGVYEKLQEEYNEKTVAQNEILKIRFSWDDADLVRFQSRLLALNIQRQGQFASLMPGFRNDWAREIFDTEDGFVFKGRMSRLMDFIFPDRDKNISVEAWILKMRRSEFAMAFILQSDALMPLDEVKKIASQLNYQDDKGRVIPQQELALAFLNLHRTLQNLIQNGANHEEINFYAEAMTEFVKKLIQQYQSETDLESQAYLRSFIEQDLNISLQTILAPEEIKTLPATPRIRTGSQF